MTDLRKEIVDYIRANGWDSFDTILEEVDNDLGSVITSDDKEQWADLCLCDADELDFDDAVFVAMLAAKNACEGLWTEDQINDFEHNVRTIIRNAYDLADGKNPFELFLETLKKDDDKLKKLDEDHVSPDDEAVKDFLNKLVYGE